MAESHFRYRGLRVVVDTSELAEYDRQNLTLTDEEMEHAALILKKTASSDVERSVGNLCIRDINGYDYIYFMGREAASVVITIWGIKRPDPKNPTEEILKRLERLDMFRGVTGL